jgi:hypothetical protein
MPHLKIVVINHESDKPVKQTLALPFCEPVDVLHVMSDGKNALPACDRIRAHDGVDGDEFFADVLGGAARLGVDFETVSRGRFVEFWLGVGGGQAFQELLNGSRDTVV